VMEALNRGSLALRQRRNRGSSWMDRHPIKVDEVKRHEVVNFQTLPQTTKGSWEGRQHHSSGGHDVACRVPKP